MVKLLIYILLRFDIISVIPDLIEQAFNFSIIKRAKEKKIIKIEIHDLKKYALNRNKKIDDYPYGGGGGMVLKIDPIARCINNLKKQRIYQEIIFMTPDGIRLNQKISNNLSLNKNLIILCGHYKGIDQRVRDLYISKEISIGDYVLSGGELPAIILIDTIIRLLPNVLNNEMSALTDSFQDNLLAPPIYTRPKIYKGLSVPDVLISGNTKKIDQWRENYALQKTKEKRPDLLNR